MSQAQLGLNVQPTKMPPSPGTALIYLYTFQKIIIILLQENDKKLFLKSCVSFRYKAIVIYIYIYVFQIFVHYRLLQILNIVHCAMLVIVLYLFYKYIYIYSSVCMLIPNT